jgi:hypothetical protein
VRRASSDGKSLLRELLQRTIRQARFVKHYKFVKRSSSSSNAVLNQKSSMRHEKNRFNLVKKILQFICLFFDNSLHASGVL